MVTPVDPEAPHLAAVAARDTPVVFVDRTPRDESLCSVAVDDALGGRMAVEHLLDLGHRRIAFVGGPMSVGQVRDRLRGDGWQTAAEVAQLADGAPVATGGIVVTRQRPGSAGGVIFVTLEDETGYVNLVVWSRIADAHRRAMLGARLLGVRGRMQQEGAVRHVVVDALEDRSALLGSLTARARNFR